MNASGAQSFLKSSGLSETFSEEDYASQSKLLQEFAETSTIDKAWTLASQNGKGSQAMFEISQPNLKHNISRKSILSSHIMKESGNLVTFEWAPFPVEMTGVSTIVPSPSGSKLLVIRNSLNDSSTCFEIWGQSQVEKEFQVPRSIHGSVYADGWFEGISWNSDETLIAYVAEEPVPLKPTFTAFGYKKGDNKEKDFGSWKGQGDWEEDWGETYEGKRQPAVFVININGGEVCAIEGIAKSISVGQVIWAPSTEGSNEYLVFTGWSSDTRKFGVKYCNNRPCALYAVKVPFPKSGASDSSPDGKSLVFLSARTGVDSGAHWASNSLHRIEWSPDRKLSSSTNIVDVIPVVMSPEDGCFPGLYCTKILRNPWLSNGSNLILSTDWRSTEAIISIDVLSGDVSRISPSYSNSYWDVLALDGDNVIAGRTVLV